MRALVTGVAGFIGSQLAERLLLMGVSVIGIDSFSDYYPRWIKERNLTGLRRSPQFTFISGNLVELDLPALLPGVSWVFHQAAQAGVRASWGTNFEVYTRDNVLATQRLLDAATVSGSSIEKFVYASSSSIYGDAESYPTVESAQPRPVSPYGVTKLAGEYLCHLYWRNHGLPAVALRYFTVFGPRQRPDMGFHIFARAMLTGKPIRVYGDGLQSRDFTFITDALDANILAAERAPAGQVFNIGGGSRITLRDTFALLEKITGHAADLHFESAQKGDARHTAADITQAQQILGYQPQVSVAEGLRSEVEWIRALLAEEPATLPTT